MLSRKWDGEKESARLGEFRRGLKQLEIICEIAPKVRQPMPVTREQEAP